MTAQLIVDDRAWKYPGGSCHLRVWEHADGTLVAILHEPAVGDGVSVANAMEGILDQLHDEYAEEYGSRPLVVQHTDAGPLGGAEWHNVVEVNGRIEWHESNPEDQAAELEVSLADLVPEGMSPR